MTLSPEKKSQDHKPKYKLQIPGLVPVDNESDYINNMEFWMIKSLSSGYVDGRCLEIASLNTFIGQKVDGDAAITRGNVGR